MCSRLLFNKKLLWIIFVVVNNISTFGMSNQLNKNNEKIIFITCPTNFIM